VSVRPFVHLSVCPSIHLFVHLSACLPAVCLSVCLPGRPPACISACLSVSRPACLSVGLSAYLLTDFVENTMSTKGNVTKKTSHVYIQHFFFQLSARLCRRVLSAQEPLQHRGSQVPKRGYLQRHHVSYQGSHLPVLLPYRLHCILL